MGYDTVSFLLFVSPGSAQNLGNRRAHLQLELHWQQGPAAIFLYLTESEPMSPDEGIILECLE